VEYPSTQYQNHQLFGGAIQVSVPVNWRELGESNNSVWFVPEGAYGQVNGQAVFTHGVNIGAAQTNSRNLEQATQEFLNGLAQGNQNLRMSGGSQRTTLSGRNAIVTTLTNVNEATGRSEVIRVATTQLRDGTLFYAISVSPQGERNFDNAYQNVFRSLRING
jgi:hypothetical protein